MSGVVEKSDSVSYMLDLREDAAEMVSKFVRRSQTLPKKRRAKTIACGTPMSEYYTCGESPPESPDVTPRRPVRSRACVRLHRDDFATDSIDLPRETSCEVIEISRSFDRMEPDMSCSTSSNSSSNFDIESEVCLYIDVQGAVSDGLSIIDSFAIFSVYRHLLNIICLFRNHQLGT